MAENFEAEYCVVCCMSISTKLCY